MSQRVEGETLTSPSKHELDQHHVSSSSAPQEEEFIHHHHHERKNITYLIPPNEVDMKGSELFMKASPMLEAVRMKFRQGRAGGRKRYCQMAYDLDLTMITSRVIATSLPTLNWFVGYFRNDATVLAKFLEEMYGKDHYMIFNLSEFRYEKQVFDGKVIDLNFPDHYNPPLDLLMMGCKSIQDWLQRDERNVVLIHCAGGKGRTGTFITAFFLYCSLFRDAIDALMYFALMRMEKPVNPFSVCQNGGINSPSQIRYITYIQHLLENKFGTKSQRHSTTNPQSYLYNNTIFEKDNLFLKKHCNIPVKRCAKMEKIVIREATQQIIEHVKANTFQCEICELRIHKLQENHSPIRNTLDIGDYEVTKEILLSFGNEFCEINGNLLEFKLPTSLSLSGDIIIIMRMKNQTKMKEFARIGFHTAFLINDRLSLTKVEIDGVHRRETVGSDFGMDFYFEHASSNDLINQSEDYPLNTLYQLPETPATLCHHHVFLNGNDFHFPYHSYLKALSVENSPNESLSPTVLHSQQVVHIRPMKFKVKLAPTLHEMDHAKGKFISLTITLG